MAEEKNITVNNGELVANCDQLSSVENRILTIRGVQVILDRDLADLYNVETKRLNEQVRRNLLRFPENFRFQLTQMNSKNWSQIATGSVVSSILRSAHLHLQNRVLPC